jgi:hypothetical protein
MTTCKSFGWLCLLIAAVASCKTPGTASESKAVFQTSATGVEVVYDLSECIAKKLMPDFNEAYSLALEQVSTEIQDKIKADTNLKQTALDNLAVYKEHLDFSKVTDLAQRYMSDHKAEIYGVSGFQLASAIPNGFVFTFYHPILETLQQAAIDRITKDLKSPVTVKLYPYIGVTMVPTCYDTVDLTGKVSGKTRWRLKFGGTFIGIWRVKATDPGLASAPAAGEKPLAIDAKDNPWHVMFGFVWGPLYEPNQLRGPLLGFGGSWARKKPQGSATLPAAAAQLPTKTGKSFGVIYRPMALWGYRDPRQSRTWSMKEMFNSLFGNAFEGYPTHMALYFDIVGGETRKDYSTTYAGFQITSSELIENFITRPIVIDNGELQANPNINEQAQ